MPTSGIGSERRDDQLRLHELEDLVGDRELPALEQCCGDRCASNYRGNPR
jgi:hypothetical protein